MARLLPLTFAVAVLTLPAGASAQSGIDKDAANCLFAQEPAVSVESCSNVITAGTPGKQGVARMYRGKSYLRLAAYRAAADDFEVVLKTNPKLAFGLYGHGVALLHLGQVATGKAEIARAIAIKSDIIAEFAESYGIPAPAYLKVPKAAKKR